MDHTIVHAGIVPAGADGGEVVIGAQDDVSAEQRAAITARLEGAAQSLGLRAQGDPVKFAWPLAPAPHFSAPGYHGISNFVDQNVAYPNVVKDYNCGSRSYDLASGYNHSGTDIFLWPFAWNKMEVGDVEVVAAAAGTIIHKEDGNYDRNCDFTNSNWNAVYVMHADGSVAWYGHLKRSSLTAKNVGDSVGVGEYLGLVGSSGSSTGPHLHFEVYDGNGDLIDPYQGNCNALNGESWWLDQRPYYDSAINEITTGNAAVVLGNCPQLSTPNAQDAFVRGSAIYFSSYYRDQRTGQNATHTIYRPDGVAYSSWSHTATSYYSASYWYWYFVGFAPNGPVGNWRYQIDYEGITYKHSFSIVDPDNVPTNTPSLTRTPSATPTDTRTRTITPTRTSTRTPTASYTASLTRTPSNTPTITPTRTPTATRTFTALPTATDTPTQTPTLTSSETPTPTATDTLTATDTPTMTMTATATDTAVPTATDTLAPTSTPTPTATAIETATPVPTASETNTPEPTATLIDVTPTPRAAATRPPNPTATHSATPTEARATATTTLSATATVPALTRCIGDCGADGAVSVNDLVRAVNIALGRAALDECPAATRSGNAVAITDLVAGVNNALRGCPDSARGTGSVLSSAFSAGRPTRRSALRRQ